MSRGGGEPVAIRSLQRQAGSGDLPRPESSRPAQAHSGDRGIHRRLTDIDAWLVVQNSQSGRSEGRGAGLSPAGPGDWPAAMPPCHVTATPRILPGSFRTFPPVTVAGCLLLGAGPWAGTVAGVLKGGSPAAGLPVPVRRRSRSPVLREDALWEPVYGGPEY